MDDGIEQLRSDEVKVFTKENVSSGLLLRDVLNRIDERILQAQKRLDEANRQVREISPKGVPVQPHNVAKANERLNYLNEARKMFFSVHDTPKTTWGEAVERAEQETDNLYQFYEAQFGKIDPKDVEGTKREEAEKLMGQIKLRDRIMTEFRNST